MSRKLINAELQGYNGPVCGAATMLQNFCDEPAWNGLTGALLDKACRPCPGYRGQFHPKTSDKYDWFWGQQFATDGGEIAVLFPWKQDFGKTDGSEFDRAIAVYTKGTVSAVEISSLLRLLILNLCEVFAPAVPKLAKRRR